MPALVISGLSEGYKGVISGLSRVIRVLSRVIRVLSVDHQSVISGLSLITDQWFIKGYPLWPHAMGAHFFQNGDPMGTQFSVKWGPNGDPRQQNGDPKSECSQN